MNTDSATNAVKEELLPVEENDNPYGWKITNIVSLAGDADGSCTTECVSGDWSANVKQENLTDVKQEPDDVRCVIFWQQFYPVLKLYSVFSLSPHRCNTLH